MGSVCPSGFKRDFSPSTTPETALPQEKITFTWMDVPMIDVDDASSCNGTSKYLITLPIDIVLFIYPR